jgi:hypothetical protein
MNPLAIALHGVGYAALVFGLQGFSPVESNQVLFGGGSDLPHREHDLRALLLAEDELLVLFVTSFTPLLR